MPEGMKSEFVYVVGNMIKCLKWYKLTMCNDFENKAALFIITLVVDFIFTSHYLTVFVSFAPRKTFKVDDMLQMIEKMKVEQDSPR